ncbi:MAG: 2-oxoacid:acceptor oxidoreductase subunit alpha [Thermodesulfobacteriota bacterium]|nr:2-oxoacid:acceptor oxidoreductase subunit alpha [Thermodesulfobacteriota bacterium]
MPEKPVLTGQHFFIGDIAAAEGALAAGCRFFAGYPITPATETAERMARRLPRVGGTYIQMEDEMASMAAILGASWGGTKAMTSTSGPGFSLMMENIGLGMMTETPCVVVNVMRGGPSTGLPTLVGQADVMQARWGSHGDYGSISLSPASPQEMFDLTIHAFNLSERYRVPVIILTDELVGHMSEKVVIPKASEIKLVKRRKPSPSQVPEDFMPFDGGRDLIPPMATAGDGFNVHVTGLTHDEWGYPVMSGAAQERLVRRLVDKIRRHAADIIMLEEIGLEGRLDAVVIAYGCTARAAREAVERARAQGRAVGLLRLITIWPFPEKLVRDLARRTKVFIVPEINYGQVALEVERCAQGLADTVSMGLMGGSLHTPEEIQAAMDKFGGRKNS